MCVCFSLLLFTPPGAVLSLIALCGPQVLDNLLYECPREDESPVAVRSIFNLRYTLTLPELSRELLERPGGLC